VIVVDDDDDFRESLCEALRSEGYDVRAARNGAEALLLARAVSPGAIVLDLMMPVMNGFELMDALDADPLLARVPRFVLTAVAPPEMRSLGGVPCFSKSLDVDELLYAVHVGDPVTLQ
jgi:CheY-like chemotaxis protein